MTTVNVQLLLHYVLIICMEKFDETKAQIRYESYENRSVPNTRQIYYGPHFGGENSKWNPRPSDLAVAFKAPDFTSQNYWNSDRRNHSSGRSFLGEPGYFGYRKPNLEAFYEFMNSFVDKGNIFRGPRPAAPRPLPEPYPYEYPYDVYSAAERNVLPPPKPIRASIVKLETVTRGPEAFIYADPPRQRPDFRPVPTRKPHFDGLHIDGLGFHSGGGIDYESESHSYPPPITRGKSRTPDNLDSTIYMQSSARVNFEKVKAPPATEGDERAPAVTHSRLSQEASTAEKEPDGDAADLEPVPGFKEDDKIKSGSSDRETAGGESKNETTFFKYKKLENDTGEEGITNETKPVKNIKPDGITNSIKIVTELTLEGLSKNKTEMVNIPSYKKFINMSGLINYELDKLKQNKIIKPRWDAAGEERGNESSAMDRNHFPIPRVNANDELSLDIKILKDTNWDGFTTEIPSIKETDPNRFNSADGYGKSKQLSTPEGNHFLNFNSSDIQDDGKNSEKTQRKLHDNNTIIVETRVTKSISKTVPISPNRFQVLKNDTLNNAYFTSPNENTSQINNFKTEKSEEIKEENHHHHHLMDAINREYAENDKFSNKTIKIEEKNRNESQQSDIIRESIDPIGIAIEQPKPMSRDLFNTDKTREPPVPRGIYNAEAVDAKPEPTTDSYLNNFNNYTINTYTRSPGEAMLFQNKTDGEIIKQVRKRKHKRVQKNKRRRTGKRRQSPSVTTPVNNADNRNFSQQTNKQITNVDPSETPSV